MISVSKTAKVEKYVLCGDLARGTSGELPTSSPCVVAIKRDAGETIECSCSGELLKRVDMSCPVVVFVQHEGGQGLPEIISMYNDDVDPTVFREMERRVSELIGRSMDE